ncbi:uncharacterized protein LOC143378534 [Andrena cerasifolii]|uniref:uncharacterized protein LOC143378534 n=1 Tax=Andrena cerasifolii TaxID=2819439 RepID=UPI0040380475
MASEDESASLKQGSQRGSKVNIQTSEVSRMKITDLREELRVRKLKTSGKKPDLVERLNAALLLDDAREDGDESESEHETDDDEEQVCNKSGYTPTFKDVEQSMEKFSGDGKRSIKNWLKDFEDTAKLCKWTETQKLIYAK